MQDDKPIFTESDGTEKPSNSRQQLGEQTADKENDQHEIKHEQDSSPSTPSAPSSSSFPPPCWTLQSSSSVRRPFKSPALTASRKAHHEKQRSDKNTDSQYASNKLAAKPLLTPTKSRSSSTTPTQPSSSTVTPSPIPPLPLTGLLRPIRFVKAKEVLNADEHECAVVSTGTLASGSADPKHASFNQPAASSTSSSSTPPHMPVAPAARRRVGLGAARGGFKVPLLSRTNKQDQETTSTTAAAKPRSEPSLLTPLKKPASASASVSAASSASTAAASSATHPDSSSWRPVSTARAPMALTHCYEVSYCKAGHRGKQYREGFLHLFQSSTALEASATDTNSASSSTIATSYSTSSHPVTPSFIKSILLTERGHHVGEVIGRDVMAYDESITLPPNKRRLAMSDDGDDAGHWNEKRKKKRRKGGEDENDDDENDSDADESKTPTHAHRSTASRSKPVLIDNVFEEGGSVVLGSWEVELGVQISVEEYERTKKLMTGELSSCPLPRHSRSSSVLVDGRPLDEKCIGYRMLKQQGLEENGGKIGGEGSRKTSIALLEPIPIRYRRSDARLGIGCKEAPPSSNANMRHATDEYGSRGRGRDEGVAAAFIKLF